MPKSLSHGADQRACLARQKKPPKPANFDAGLAVVARQSLVPEACTREPHAVAMRPSPAQAKARVDEYIAFLEEHGVPTALFKERVKDIVDWGDSVRLRKPVPAAPKSAEMKGIQSALNEMCRSEKYVRDQRRGEYPHYPYASEEQKTLAETLSGIDMSQQAKESILKALHGDGGKAPLLRQDLQQSKLLSMKAMDECAKNLPRHVHRFASYCP